MSPHHEMNSDQERPAPFPPTCAVQLWRHQEHSNEDPSERQLGGLRRGHLVISRVSKIGVGPTDRLGFAASSARAKNMDWRSTNRGLMPYPDTEEAR
jgi:hypothetical protein